MDSSNNVNKKYIKSVLTDKLNERQFFEWYNSIIDRDDVVVDSTAKFLYNLRNTVKSKTEHLTLLQVQLCVVACFIIRIHIIVPEVIDKLVNALEKTLIDNGVKFKTVGRKDLLVEFDPPISRLSVGYEGTLQSIRGLTSKWCTIKILDGDLKDKHAIIMKWNGNSVLVYVISNVFYNLPITHNVMITNMPYK